MTARIKSTGLLARSIKEPGLFRDWAEGESLVEFRACLESPLNTNRRPAPLFAGSWIRERREILLADHAGTEGKERLAANLDALEYGRAGVVVTGQQPGWMGGPLYTLYKVATAVVLARRLSDSGRPTVPVFWCGDDDDDLPEALSSRCWDPGKEAWLGGPDPEVVKDLRGRRLMVGPLASSTFEAGAAAWLAERAEVHPDPLARALADVWSTSLAEGGSWSDLNRRALVRMFASDGLVVVQGNDSSLQDAAGPLYRQIGADLGGLQDLVREQGRNLVERGWHAQIEDRSVARPLFLAEGEHRRPWDPGSPWPDRSGAIRPGVMLRSPVQDWLLEPRAVVVGPGELAYLKQLEPLYAALGIPRSPMIPRMFGWLMPPDLSLETLDSFCAGSAPDADRIAVWTRRAADSARAELEEILVREIGIESDRARQLAEGRTRRWTKGVSAMLRDEWARQLQSEVPTQPAWVFPDGQRQERLLSLGWACGCWGSGLIEDVLAAAGLHLDAGRDGAWNEWALTVEEPRV